MLLTTDIYLAAALMSLGAKLDNVNRDDPRHMEFAMEMEPQPLTFDSQILRNGLGETKVVKASDAIAAPLVDLKNYEKQWMNGELMVNAVKFAEAIKRMKSVVHSR